MYFFFISIIFRSPSPHFLVSGTLVFNSCYLRDVVKKKKNNKQLLQYF